MRRRNPCSKCPKYEKGWCNVLAKRVSPEQPVCDKGRKFIASAQSRASMARRKAEKRAERTVAVDGGDRCDDRLVRGTGKVGKETLMEGKENEEVKEGVAEHIVEQRFLLDMRPGNGKTPMTAKALAAICSSLATVCDNDTEWFAVPYEGKTGTIMFEQWRYI